MLMNNQNIINQNDNNLESYSWIINNQLENSDLESYSWIINNNKKKQLLGIMHMKYQYIINKKGRNLESYSINIYLL